MWIVNFSLQIQVHPLLINPYSFPLINDKLIFTVNQEVTLSLFYTYENIELQKINLWSNSF